ncbi:MAG TPA: thioredoxin domain-containing protein, partial [Blastocatellia bacterium]|nr:thioredoxin domain-containing protein [Blastocatellia bacterium]
MSETSSTNRLINETSPYLLQHAHNPVDWYPWGPEAIEKARREDKAILLSIGYSACHWCHVMAHESFENAEIARAMNENFVCIKVDREERPDVDSIYMSAVQMMTGHGGWPLTVFLLPDLKPFYGGTYFPPLDRQGMPGFPRVLNAIADSYRTRKADLLNSAGAITEELQKANRFRQSVEMLTTEVIEQAFAHLVEGFDESNGGFGSAPKFPPSMNLMFLLRHHKRTNSGVALEMVELTLNKMAAGGMYDHLGGGFHRYSVDDRWQVPHFEKMLYDNALLARVYLYAYQATKRPQYRRIAEEILEYVVRDLTDSSGGFYSSEDADSEGEEGKFYTWTLEQLRAVLGNDREADLVAAYFNVSAHGNFEHGTSILNTPRTLAQFAGDESLDESEVQTAINRGRKALFYHREERARPGRDDKVLTGWNALMLTAFAEAANILGRDDYRQIAVRNAEFIREKLILDGRVLRTYKNGKAKLKGYLEDYAYLVEAMLAVYEATFQPEYFEQACRLADAMIELFSDESEPGFYFTASDHEELIARVKEYFDNAIPSGNSVAALVLLKLALLTGDNRYQRPALAILRMMQQAVSRYPAGFGYLLSALDFYLSEPKEIAIVGKPGSHEVIQFIREIYSRYIPNKVVALSEPDDKSIADTVQLLRGRKAIENKPTVYVCRDYTCMAPVTTPE